MLNKKNITILSLFFILLYSVGCRNRRAPEIKDMVYIPQGEFIIGSNEKDYYSLAKEYGSRHGVYFKNEEPERKINLKGFYIDRFEVTNSKYLAFVKQTGYRPPDHWRGINYPVGKGAHPVTFVSWIDAYNFCKWAGKRLPTEEEWEKAARGPNGNIYPWGDIFDNKKGNFSKGDTVPAGTIKEDKSYYGVFDLGGNVMEWTGSWYKPYPGTTFQSNEFGEKNRVLKGGYGSMAGHYSMGNINGRGSFRNYFKPSGKGFDVGFRCVKERDGG